jgi:hypothetical protein
MYDEVNIYKTRIPGVKREGVLRRFGKEKINYYSLDVMLCKW